MVADVSALTGEFPGLTIDPTVAYLQETGAKHDCYTTNWEVYIICRYSCPMGGPGSITCVADCNDNYYAEKAICDA